MHDIDPEEALRWLKDRPHADVDTWTGCFAGGWEAVVAVLHPMTLDAPVKPGDEVWDSEPRLRWRDAFTVADLPAGQNFPPRHWNWSPKKLNGVNVFGPWEGQLYDDMYSLVGQRLLEHTAGGLSAELIFYWATFASPDWTVDLGVASAGIFDEFDGACRRGPGWLSPSNIWPADQSWLFCTGYDDLMTFVAGSTELIESLEADDVIETVRMEWRDGALHGV